MDRPPAVFSPMLRRRRFLDNRSGRSYDGHRIWRSQKPSGFDWKAFVYHPGAPPVGTDPSVASATRTRHEKEPGMIRAEDAPLNFAKMNGLLPAVVQHHQTR